MKREWWIRFSGDPKFDEMDARRDVSACAFTTPFPDEEVIHVIEYSEYERLFKALDDIALESGQGSDFKYLQDLAYRALEGK